MASYTKADYTAAYSICPRGIYQYPDGHTEPRRFTEMRLHYHPTVIKPITSDRLNRILEKYAFSVSDVVVVFGAGFGWLCEELENRFNCTTIGIDTSQYIIDNKDLSPDDELLESIVAAGLDAATGKGKQIWDQFSQPGIPRTTANIKNLDLRLNKDVNELRRQVGTPTHVITEEVWQLLTDAERIDYQAAFDSLGVITIHVIDGVVI